MQARQQRRRKTFTRVARRHLKVYPFEAAILAQLAILHLFLYSKGLHHLAVIHHSVTTTGRLLVPVFLAGLVAQALAAALGSGLGAYLRRIRRWPWIFLSLRLLLASALVVHIYVWIKSMLPLLHRRLFDEIFWEIDRWLFFGVSPNVLSLYLFQQPAVLRAIDVSYGAVFAGSFLGALAIFFTCRWDRLRIAFATGFSLLWLAGAWLYLATPSLGPCYVFPEVWKPFVPLLPASTFIQQALWENYQMVPMIGRGMIPPEFNLNEGIAAFPSIHVGLQMFVALWVARLWRFMKLPAYVSVALVFVGSIVTGWHYFIDSAAGLLLGWGAYRLGCRLAGLRRVEANRRPRPAAAPGAAGSTPSAGTGALPG